MAIKKRKEFPLVIVHKFFQRSLKINDGKPLVNVGYRLLELVEWNISFDNLVERKIGIRDNTHLWKDAWFDNTTLKAVFLKKNERLNLY